MSQPKRGLSTLVLLLFLPPAAFFLCEYLIYYIAITGCSWPAAAQTDATSIKLLIFSDTHLLGHRLGNWFDRLRREWQMERAFQTSVNLLQPHASILLGDALDEGKVCISCSAIPKLDFTFTTTRLPMSLKVFIWLTSGAIGLILKMMWIDLKGCFGTTKNKCLFMWWLATMTLDSTLEWVHKESGQALSHLLVASFGLHIG